MTSKPPHEKAREKQLTVHSGLGSHRPFPGSRRAAGERVADTASRLALPSSGAQEPPFGRAVPSLLQAAYVWGRAWDTEGPRVHSQQVREETRQQSPAQTRVYLAPFPPPSVVRAGGVGEGREDTVCKARPPWTALMEFIHLSTRMAGDQCNQWV